MVMSACNYITLCWSISSTKPHHTTPHHSLHRHIRRATQSVNTPLRIPFSTSVSAPTISCIPLALLA